MKNQYKLLILIIVVIATQKTSANLGGSDLTGPGDSIISCQLHGVGFVGYVASHSNDPTDLGQQCFNGHPNDSANLSEAHIAAHANDVPQKADPTLPECFTGHKVHVDI